MNWYDQLKLLWCNFAKFNSLHCPQFTHPVQVSVKQSKEIDTKCKSMIKEMLSIKVVLRFF